MTPEELDQLQGPSLPSAEEMMAEQRIRRIQAERAEKDATKPSTMDVVKAVPPMIMEFVRNPHLFGKTATSQTPEQEANVDAISGPAPAPEAPPPGRENEMPGLLDDAFRIIFGAATDAGIEMFRFAGDVHRSMGILPDEMLDMHDNIQLVLDASRIRRGEGLVENLMRDMGRFLGVYALGRKIMPGPAAGPANEVRRDLVAGAIADSTMLNPDEMNLSMLLKESFGFEGPFLDWLAEPSDNPMIQRGKNAVEGAVIGILANTLVEGSKWGIRNQQLIRERAAMMLRGGPPSGTPAAQRGMVAFHGSPHRFEPEEGAPLGRFRVDKIGTGEGAQAYGHGIYLAESPDVAGTYRALNGPAGQGAAQVDLVNLAMKKAGGDRKAAKNMIHEWAQEAPDNFSRQQYYDAHNNLDALLDNPPGSLYTVDLPDEQIEKMLDWDKPLSEQPESVRKAIRETTFDDQGAVSGAELLDKHGDTMTGRHIYDLIVPSGEKYRSRSEVAPEASRMWAELGIPGIRYLDGTSRKAGEGTRNFVLFDPSIATITGRNGERVPLEAESPRLMPQGDNPPVSGAADSAATKAKRGEYPVEDGWAPRQVQKIGEDGKPVYKKQGWGLAQTKDGKPLKGPARKGAITRASKRLVAEVRRVMERAQGEGPDAEAAQYIMKQATWYRSMRQRLREEFGGLGDMFADLLGAGSPNTKVRDNWNDAIGAFRRFTRGDFDDQLADLEQYLANGGKISKYPDDKIILKENGSQYSINSRNLMLALLDMWRSTAKQPGTAPKARNFSGNLIGTTDEATIDVWAARLLRRMLGKDRIPTKDEAGVGGTVKVDGTPGGDFGFGQEIFRQAGRELGLDPDELQAIAWFIEKEIWDKNGWTTEAGGSFDEMADAAGLRRATAGFSTQTTLRQPTDADMDAARQALERQFKGQEGVVGYKALPTLGRYGGTDERAFDIELVVDPTWTPERTTRELVNMARQYDQQDVFVTRVLGPGETSPNARPGIEIYLRQKQSVEELQPILDRINEMGVDGFTFSVDYRAGGRQGAGDGTVGIRIQWVPEIKARFDDDLLEGLQSDPARFAAEADAARMKMQEVVDTISNEFSDLVTMTKRTENDTIVIGREMYDDFLAGSAGEGTGGGNYPVWFGRPGSENVAAATRRIAGEGRESAFRGADVPGGANPQAVGGSE